MTRVRILKSLVTSGINGAGQEYLPGQVCMWPGDAATIAREVANGLIELCPEETVPPQPAATGAKAKAK